MTSKRKPYQCSRCGQVGHNKRTCKADLNEAEVAAAKSVPVSAAVPVRTEQREDLSHLLEGLEDFPTEV